jgi:hypothetical protein
MLNEKLKVFEKIQNMKNELKKKKMMKMKMIELKKNIIFDQMPYLK